jgi:hypothetical protein
LRTSSFCVALSSPGPPGAGGGIVPPSICSHISSAQSTTFVPPRPTMAFCSGVSAASTTSKLSAAGAPKRVSPVALSEGQRPPAQLEPTMP